MTLLEALALPPEGRVPLASTAAWHAVEFRLRHLASGPCHRFRTPAALRRLFHTTPFSPKATWALLFARFTLDDFCNLLRAVEDRGLPPWCSWNCRHLVDPATASALAKKTSHRANAPARAHCPPARDPLGRGRRQGLESGPSGDADCLLIEPPH